MISQGIWIVQLVDEISSFIHENIDQSKLFISALLENITCISYRLLISFQNQFFPKILSEISSECQTV